MSDIKKFYFGKYENGEYVVRKNSSNIMYSSKSAVKNASKWSHYYAKGQDKISVYEIEIDLSKAVQVE